ncbi:hypothetical protein ACED96_14660 [Clostridium thermobutyricum]
MDIKKIIKIVFVDFTSVILGILNGFIIPKFLSIESYVYLKTFILYIGYSGMIHLGFSDGIYILLGGKNINEIKKSKINGYLNSMLKIIIVILLLLLIVNNVLIKDKIINYFIIYTIPFQVTLFFSLIYRATNQLNKYTKIRIIINIIQLISTLSVIFLNKNADIYITIQILGYYFLAAGCIYILKRENLHSEVIKNTEILNLIKIGSLVMLANTTNNLIISLDRWVVKLNFSDIEFAFYSFGSSLLSLFITLIGSISIVFYPYLSKNKGIINKVLIRRYIFITASFAPAGYFIMEFIINKFLHNYIDSLDIVGILILIIPFMSVINIVYSNLYKSLGKEKEYFITSAKVLGISLVLNILAINLSNDVNFIAIATLVTLIIWYFYSAKHFNEFKFNIKELIFIIIYLIGYFWVKNLKLFELIKSIIFIIIIILSVIVLFKKDIITLKKFLIKK